jgi:thiamine biosynthesis lipoprotein
MKKAVASLLFCVLLIFTSCSNETERDFFAMDTYMHMTVYGECDDGLEQAEKLIKALDDNFSVTSKGELALLNSAGTLNAPSKEFLEMLECSKILYERTDGAYDVTTLALSELWARCEKENREPTDSEINSALALVGMDKIEFNESVVRLNGVKGIDLGSIAKGFAGREAARSLKEKGALGGVLTLGGNVETFGKKSSGEPFKVGITDPNDPDAVCGYVTLDGGSVVTSGKYNRHFVVGNKTFHHIIDARTGFPCDNGVASVTVIASDGMWADALSTALLLLGEQGMLDYYEEFGGFEAVIVMDDGRVVATQNARFTKAE